MRIRRRSPIMPSCLAQMSASSRHSAGLSYAICAWTRVESPPIKISSRARARRSTVDPGSARRPRRACNLPQRRERLLRSQGESARPSRFGDGRRPRGRHLRWRVDHRVRRMDQRSRLRSAVQGAVSQDLSAEFNRRYREISRLWNDPGHRPGLRQEDGQGLWRPYS